MNRRPRRWSRAVPFLVPVTVLGLTVAVGVGVFRPRSASSTGQLPAMTPTALIAGLRRAHVSGMSGTVVTTMSLGLPAVASAAGLGRDDESSPAALLSGSHTLQVWYAGSARQRITLYGALDETDLFRDGADLWEWNSADRLAVHTRLPAGGTVAPTAFAATAPDAPTALQSVTPDQLAREALSRLGPGTRVRVVQRPPVADRSAYDLVLTPLTAGTLVGSVHIAVDGRTMTPLGVRVFARGVADPAIDATFTSVRFVRPAEGAFDFTPPPGAQIRTVAPGRPLDAPDEVAATTATARATANDGAIRQATGTGRGGKTARTSTAPEPSPTATPPAPVGQPTVRGTGWTRVVDAPPGSDVLPLLRPAMAAASPVRGSWGSGRLLRTPLVDVLVLPSGRMLAGSVGPAALYAAAG